MIGSMSVNGVIELFEQVFFKKLGESGAQVAPEVLLQTKGALSKIKQRIKLVALMRQKGEVTAAAATTLLSMEKESVTLHLLAVMGMSKVLIQSSVNAAMSAVEAALNALSASL